jgi:hypothetical protein
MKKTLFLFLVFLMSASIASAQDKANIDSLLPIDENSGLIKYQDVVEVKGSPAELYDRAELWVKSYFPNPAGMLGSRSKEQGFLEGTVRLRIYDVDKKGSMVGSPRIVYCTMRLEFKDNRYRYTFSSFKLQATSNYPLERWLNSDSPYFSVANFPYLRQVNTEMEKLIEKLEEGMEPKIEAVDEW